MNRESPFRSGLEWHSPTRSYEANYSMTIPTEPIGSIPRPLELIDAVAAACDDGTSPAREIAFAKFAPRVRGMALAAENLAQRR